MKTTRVLADFSIEMKVPLLLSEKGPLRFAVWTSPDLNKLFKTQNENCNLLGSFQSNCDLVNEN